MTFTLFWISTRLYRKWFSHKIWIQEKFIYTDHGFSLKSDFTKKIIYADNSSTPSLLKAMMQKEELIKCTIYTKGKKLAKSIFVFHLLSAFMLR